MRVLPPLPSLQTFCTTLSPSIKPEMYSSIRAEFEAGWAEGIAVLSVARARMRESAKNGVNVVRFSQPSTLDRTSESDSEGGSGIGTTSAAMYGLEKLDKKDDDAFTMPPGVLTSVPTICFAGPKNVVDHAPGCGHSIARAIWRD
ncbi:hypothetical protein NMY22_g16319 [Coprinellus aureogranulatus]|nr:hypothetical protein NMY22_g16319 [Coprinellus aureogranulatus]